jgi:hypothetical protein
VLNWYFVLNGYLVDGLFGRARKSKRHKLLDPADDPDSFLFWDLEVPDL